MGAQISVTLPEDVLQRAELWAQRTGRPVGEFLAETIELSMRPLGDPLDGDKPLADWPDEDVLAAADAQVGEDDDRRLSELLHRQQAGSLSGAEPAELAARMQVYQRGLLQKARALHEAVRRGLREPLQP